MRCKAIRNAKLGRAISEMGHDDIMLVVDAGYPMACEDRVIDLALCPGVPDLLTVLHAIRQDMWVGEYHMVDDARANNPNAWNGVADAFPDVRGGVKPNAWFHKGGYRTAKFIIRTGVWMPWGNVALLSGIPVRKWFANTGVPVPESWANAMN